MEPDPYDPDAHTVTDVSEGATEGRPVDSVNGSELLSGGE